MKLSQRWLAVVCLLVFFGLALDTAVSQSPTVDETIHLFRGVAIWQTGQFQYQHAHPPLAHRLIGSLPMLLEPTIPAITDLPNWNQLNRNELADLFLWGEQRPQTARFVLLGRLTIIFTGLVLGAVAMRWAGKLGGPVALAVAGFLFAFDPNTIAHLSLATTDGILTVTYFLTLFALWRYWQRPSSARLLLLGGILGLALAAKLTAGVLIPIILLLTYLHNWRLPSQQTPPWWQPLRFLLLLAPIAAFVIWASYGFSIRQPTLLPITIPLPAATYFDNLYELATHFESGHRAYLLGETSGSGWWYYFLVALLVKTPAATLLLLLSATGMIIWQRGERMWSTAVLWLPAILLFSFASISGLNIGYRHILPVIPFLWLLAAIGVHWLWTHRRARPAVLTLLTLYAAFVLFVHPHHLAYFNWLVGGPAQGYRYLGDSNLDWGQDLPLLVDYAAQQTRPFHYAYFGSARPAAYGLTAPQLNDLENETINFAVANPAAGKYAISATYIQGISMFEPDTFDWFRRQTPTGTLGYSIFLYDVAAPAPGSWVAHCNQPMLDPAAAEAVLGVSSVRHIYFDCQNSWVFPNDGAPGWYVLPQRSDWLLPALLPDTLTPVFEHNATELATGYVVYYWPGENALADWLATLPQTAVSAAGTTLTLPQTIAKTATLHGYGHVQNQWFTVWKALRQPDQPISIAGHLYTNPAAPPTVADGLGYSQNQWQPGDFWVQQHRFADSNGRYLETGLYTFTDGSRLPVDGTAQTTFLQLPSP